MKFGLSVTALALLFTSCAHVHSFHQEPIASGAKGKSIVYEGEHTVWFRFDSDTSWVQGVRESFVSQCSTGNIQGVSSRLSTMNSFLHWKYHLRIQGFCVEN